MIDDQLPRPEPVIQNPFMFTCTIMVPRVAKNILSFANKFKVIVKN